MHPFFQKLLTMLLSPLSLYLWMTLLSLGIMVDWTYIHPVHHSDQCLN